MTRRVSARLLRRLVHYDPDTGLFTWRERPVWMFKTLNACRTWSSRFAGKPAFSTPNANGYLVGAIFKKLYYGHQAAWCYVHGYWPKGVDHIDGNEGNNRLANLRSGDQSQNAKNMARRYDNTSGCTGVYRAQSGNGWRAMIKVDGECIHLGSFSDFAAAVDARKAAEIEHGFHSNHGRCKLRGRA